MRYVPLMLSAALAVTATPALAGETYVESTGGVIWNREYTEAVTAFTVGHDIDLGERFFIGADAFAEKVLARETRVVWGVGGRVGTRPLPGAKLYAAANWQTKDCRACGSAVGLSTGWEQDLNEKVYAKVEYKHLLIGDNERDSDLVAVGLGYKF